MSAEFGEVGDRVYVSRQAGLDVNVSLVVGEATALIIDTLATPAEAARMVAAARRITDLPWTVVNTHHHFDHCFGNAVVAGDPPAPIWAHQETARLLHRPITTVRAEAYREMAPTSPGLAAALHRASVLPPTHTVVRTATLDLGGRGVELWHPGRGHTAGDLVVHVPDAGVLIAGDLVEQGAPPAFSDAYPLEWPDTVTELLRRIGPATVVVPGHGATVDRDFVHTQHADLVAMEWLIRDGHADGAPAERVVAHAPFDPETARLAVGRGYAQLANRT